MKINPLLLFLCLPAWSQAEPVQLSFDSVTLNDFTKVVLSDVLKKNYVLYDSLIVDEKPLTVSYQASNQKDVLDVYKIILKERGFDITQAEDTFFIHQSQKPNLPADFKVLSYKPKYRSSQFLISQVHSIFDKVKFSFNRAAKTDQNQLEALTNFDSIIYAGEQKEVEAISQLFETIDTAQSQAQITAYLVEVSKTDSKQSSIALIANLLKNALAINLVNDTLANTITFSAGDFSSILSALTKDSRFNVVSTPSMIVKDRENGVFSVGQDVPVLGQISNDAAGRVTQSVIYRPSGVILDFKPIFQTDAIDLTIKHELSNFVQTQTGVNNTPTLIKRSINTTVRSGFDDVILLGGLSESKDEVTRAGVPLLPFATAKTTSKSQSNIVLMLHVKRI